MKKEGMNERSKGEEVRRKGRKEKKGERIKEGMKKGRKE